MLMLVGILLVTVIIYFKYVLYTYWEKLGVPFIKPTLIFGNLGRVTLRKTSFGLNIYELYQQTKEPFIGIYLYYRPALLVRDASLVKQILSTDFNHFVDRGMYSRPKEDPISDSLFAMTGNRWRNLRAKFTPLFTTGRLKSMMPAVNEKADNLQNILKPFADNGEITDIKNWSSRYALDVIATVFFGLDVDTIADPKHVFRTIEKGINDTNYISAIIPILIFLCPQVLEKLRFPSLPADVKKFVIDLVTDQIEIREKQNVTRKDFIQMLIQIRNGETVSSQETEWDIQHIAKATEKTMSIELCAAQIFIFYVAGFDTTASTVACTIFECARNPDVQKRLQHDIDTALEKHQGKLTYECMQDMTYLDLCVMETVRKYPSLPLLNRVCTKDYNIPDTDITIKEGTAIVISLMGQSRDEKYFPEPMAYKPERYLESNPQYNKEAYIPFGDGPRTCLGVRLGKITSKLGIIKLLSKYNFEALDDKELEFQANGVMLQYEIPIKISHRK